MRDDQTDRQLRVTTALYVNENEIGQRGADHIHIALEAAVAAATESFMRTQSGVLSWATSRHSDSAEPSDA